MTRNIVDVLYGQLKKALDWLAQSPRVNPIENVWLLLKESFNESICLLLINYVAMSELYGG